MNNDWPVLEVGSYANKQVIEPTKAPQVGFASTSGGKCNFFRIFLSALISSKNNQTKVIKKGLIK